VGRHASPLSIDATYAYRAARPNGAIERGQVSADSHDTVATMLMRRGLFPIEIRLDQLRRDRNRSLPLDDLAVGLRVLAALLDADLPILRALTMLGNLVPKSWDSALESVTASIREGHSLASAMSSSPVSFPPVVIGILQAGEGGSGLAHAVCRAADLMESTAQTKSAIRGALAYPALLAMAGTVSIGILVGVVLPRFGAILADLGQPLPTSTRIVLSVADLARVLLLPGIVAIVTGVYCWQAWIRTPTGGRQWSTLLLSAPLVGAIRFSSATARACAALSALLDSGVPLSQAMVHGGRASGDLEIGARILAARELIIDGQSLARSLDEQHALTVSAIRLARAGEETGRLAVMLGHAARLEGEIASLATKTLVRALEPVMILLFGAIVALVAASLLQAIYSVRPS
jgi:type II secretory pathway component PulF